MTWEAFDPYPEYPALWSHRAGRVLVACRRYMAGQFRLQVSVEGEYGWDMMTPEF